MNLHIGAVEWFWLGTNGTAWVLTLLALRDAWRSQRVIRELNGRARELVARANVRREVVRLAVQTLLLLIVLPGLVSNREPDLLNPVVAGLLLVPLLLLVNTALDLYERQVILKLVLQDAEEHSHG